MIAEDYKKRHLIDRCAQGLCLVAALIALVPLGSVLSFVFLRGASSVNWDLFTQLPAPVGELGGGMANAMLGTLQLVGLASALSIPVGILAGIYLADIRTSRLRGLVRFSVDVMSGVPSITIGIFVYTLVVVTMRRFSAIAGAIALAIIMLPTITRSAEELIRLVPSTLREAALGLGVSNWRATLKIVIRTAAPGIVTGVMLAVARAAGETAPLLFTAFNSSEWSEGLDEPMASLPVQIYTYAVSPYDEWHRQAWGASLVLVAFVLVTNVAAKLFARRPPGA